MRFSPINRRQDDEGQNEIRHSGGRKLAAEMVSLIGSIQIAEPDSIIVSGGMRNGQTVKTVSAIRPDYTSVELEELPIPLKHHCSTIYAGQVFVIGGTTGIGFPKNNVFVLMNGRSWRETSSLVYSRYFHYLCEKSI